MGKRDTVMEDFDVPLAGPTISTRRVSKFFGYRSLFRNAPDARRREHRTGAYVLGT